jgi:hypothetical protein
VLLRQAFDLADDLCSVVRVEIVDFVLFGKLVELLDGELGVANTEDPWSGRDGHSVCC